jgi:energy-coupling factor transporter ATP-binding protein EcfA2
MTETDLSGPPKTSVVRIRYPRFNQLYEDIGLCQELSTAIGEPQCMALEGATGVGKSTLVTAYAEAFPRYETATGIKVPVFYLETPSPVTVKGMAARMLEALGDPAAHRGPLWSMNSRLIYYLGEDACGVRLVILDDFHHLIDKRTHRILETVSDWLKVLIKETRVPFLVVGTEGQVRQILQTNDQLSRLFAVRETLAPFPWDDTDYEVVKSFAAFIKYIEESLALPFSDEVPRQELLRRLHYATAGVVGSLVKLLHWATALARCGPGNNLTLAALSQAFAKCRDEDREPKQVDPFTWPPDQRFLKPQVALANNDSSPKQAGRTSSVVDVLTTRQGHQ